MNIKIKNSSGSLSHALGVSDELIADLDSFVNNVILEGGSLLDIVTRVHAAYDLTDNEGAAFYYALGYFMAKSGN